MGILDSIIALVIGWDPSKSDTIIIKKKKGMKFSWCVWLLLFDNLTRKSCEINVTLVPQVNNGPR